MRYNLIVPAKVMAELASNENQVSGPVRDLDCLALVPFRAAFIVIWLLQNPC